MLHGIKRFFGNVARAAQYAKLGYSNHDFDYGYIEKYLAFKLPRLLSALENGYGDLSYGNMPKAVKALKLSIKLLKRLERPSSRFCNLHDQKWGAAVINWAPVANGRSRLNITRPNVITEADRKQEREEFLAAMGADERREIRDRALLYTLLGKYITNWWD